MLRAYLGLVKKEFIQVWRDRNMLWVIFAMPIIQLLLLGYAVNTDVKLMATDIYDFDQSRLSREFVQSFEPGEYFVTSPRLLIEDQPLWELESRFRSGSAEIALILPEDFSEKLNQGENVTIGMLTDGTDANAARAGLGYAAQIVRRFSEQVTGLSQPVELRHKFLYNPELESVYYMVPGIVATLLTMVGSPVLLFLLSALYLVTTLGIGMFFSTVTSTQQQAMFLAWFFSVFAILTSGFFTPISNMPGWLQPVTFVNPMRYFMEIVRGIMMKGAGMADLLPEIIALVVYGTVIFSLSAARFRKRTA